MNTLKLMMITALTLSTSLAFAESGTCSGKTKDGKAVKISYFTNGYSDDNIDYYAKISVAGGSDATYALSIGTPSISGDATSKSKKAGLDYGSANLVFSANKKSVSGNIGSEELENLPCSYSAN